MAKSLFTSLINKVNTFTFSIISKTFIYIYTESCRLGFILLKTNQYLI